MIVEMGLDSMGRMEGKVALVTGAGSGIGEAIARAFAAEGARVMVSDIRDEAGRQVADSLAAGAQYRHLDVREEAEWAAAMGAILEAYGRVDVVVNNAGITGLEGARVASDPENTALEDWRAVFATNVDGTFLGCKYAIQAMRGQGAGSGSGSIVNISSRSGLVGIPGAAAYAASKAAIRNHTKTVALYCAEQGLKIRCNSIHPAAILTPMWEPMLGEGAGREERMQAVVAGIPVRRFGRPDEVAAIAVLLASDEVTYMTGTEVNLDGGLLAGAAAVPKRA